MSAEALARVSELLAVARRIADPGDPLGARARDVLPVSTGLSPAGVDLALREHLEHSPPRSEIEALLASVEPARGAHVLLSANVFVAALRALALGLASSSRVSVRASRREPELVALLHAGAPRLFSIVDRLAPDPGDHVWAYGTAETLRSLRGELPSGAVLHAHGPGLAALVVDLTRLGDERRVAAAAAVARDVALFDQRGCASPRLGLLLGSSADARAFAESLARAAYAEEAVNPRGALSADEQADAVRYRDLMTYAGAALPAGRGLIGLDLDGRSTCIAPVGRHLHLVRVEPDQVVPRLSEQAESWVTLGLETDADSARLLREHFPGVRQAALGRLQRPAFDGSLDRRAASRGTAV